MRDLCPCIQRGLEKKKSQARCFSDPRGPEARMKLATISPINEIFTPSSSTSPSETGLSHLFMN